MYVSSMGVLYDYFSAPDDAAAAAVIDRVGGPGAPEAVPPTEVARFGGEFTNRPFLSRGVPLSLIPA